MTETMDHSQTRRIQERVTARREADQLLQLAADCTQHMTDDGRAAFWSRVREEVAAALPPEPTPPPQRDAFVAMGDTEARLFEQRQMQFGIHKGRRISEVPLKYLDWLSGQPDTFIRELARYLGNENVAKLLTEELSDATNQGD